MHKQEELEEAMARSNEDNKQILAKETELFKIRQERAEAENKLERLYDLDSCYKSVMLIDTFDKLHELEEECVRRTEAYNTFIDDNTRAGYVPTDSYITEIGMARRGVNDAYHALAEADDAYTREKKAIGITREIEGAIELADEEGGEENILSRAVGYVKGLAKNIALTTVGALGIIAVLVYEIIAKGTLAGVVFRVIGGVLGAGALALTVVALLGILKNKKNISALASKFGVSGYGDLKGKINVISAARAKRDGMIKSTEDARVALEAARLNYENAKQELTRVIIRWGEEPPTSSLNDFLDKLEAKVATFLERKKLLLEEKNTIELTVKELRHSLADKNEIDIRGQVPPLKRKALTHINHDEIITSIAAYKNRSIQRALGDTQRFI